jgi:hypothetical protein
MHAGHCARAEEKRGKETLLVAAAIQAGDVDPASTAWPSERFNAYRIFYQSKPDRFNAYRIF